LAAAMIKRDVLMAIMTTAYATDLRLTALQCEVRAISSATALASLREAWSTLARDAENCPGNMTFEYCALAASGVLAHGGSVRIAMVSDDMDLLALWPVSISRSGLLRIATPLTCGTGEEYGGPLVRAGAGSVVLKAAIETIRQVDADVLKVPLVQNDSPLQRALRDAPQPWVLALTPAPWRTLPGFSIRLRGFPRWDDLLLTLPGSLRSSLRYRHKKLETRGRPEFGWCRSVSDAASVIAWLFDNKRRWAQSHGLKISYLNDNRTRDFFIELADQTDLSSIPLVAFVKLNGIPVAASINLVGARTVEGFVTTYDEAFATCSVGVLLTEFLVRWSHANGRDFDFRPLYSECKASWANCRTRHETQMVLLSARGRLVEFSLLATLLDRATQKLSEAAFDWFGRGQPRNRETREHKTDELFKLKGGSRRST